MSEENHNRACPSCAEIIRTLARSCRHCHYDLTVDVKISSPEKPPSAKELHKLALKLMQFKPGTFSYHEIKRALSDPNSKLRSKITYAHALELEQHIKACGLALVIEDSPKVLPKQPSADASAALSSPSYKTIWPISGMHIALILLALVAEGAYLSKKHWIKHFSKVAETTPTQSQPSSPAATRSLDESVTVKPPQQGTVQDNLVRATVTITDGRGVGSGFFVTSQGHLITNVHVVERMSAPRVLMEGGATFEPTLLRMEKNLDIALLKVNGVGRFPHLQLGDATNTTRGETIWTIGAPMGLTFTLTKGIVSFVGRNMNGVAYLQTDAAINGGNSGGPMVNEKGEVIGINTFIIRDSEGLGFSLPINYLTMGPRPILEGIVDIRETNNSMRTWLAYANESNAIKASFDASRPVSPRTTDNSSSYLSGLIKESQKMDSDYEQLKGRLNQEINSLNLQRQDIEKKYSYDKALQISVSQETALGKDLKRLGGEIINRQIFLLEKTGNYYNGKQRKLKEVLAFAKDESLKYQVQSMLTELKYLLDQNQQTLVNKQQELKELKAQQY